MCVGVRVAENLTASASDNVAQETLTGSICIKNMFETFVGEIDVFCASMRKQGEKPLRDFGMGV